MNLTTKASIAISGTLTSDEVKGLVVAGVKAEAIKGDASGLVFTSSSVTFASDGTASVDLVYEKADAPAPAPAAAADPLKVASPGLSIPHAV